jgi:hypothetical protein
VALLDRIIINYLLKRHCQLATLECKDAGGGNQACRQPRTTYTYRHHVGGATPRMNARKETRLLRWWEGASALRPGRSD